MKIHCFDDDARKNDADYAVNHGSFAAITLNLNKELAKLGLYGDEHEADIFGFASGIKLNFGFTDKKKFHIGVFESNILPDFIVNWAKTTDTKVLALSDQLRDVYATYGLDIPVVDIGADIDFWKPMPEIKKFDKFTILSVTSCNFRSGINMTINAFIKASLQDPNIRLIVKNTDNRATALPEIIKQLNVQGFDIEYICERQTIIQIRELMAKCHLLAYNPLHTSAGLPIVEAAAMQLPCIVGDYSPTNLYPSVEKINWTPVPIAKVKKGLCEGWGLPYTFAGLGVDENKALVHWFDLDDYANKLLTIVHNYDNIYINKAKQCREEVLKRWTWAHSCQQLLKNIQKS